MNFKVEIDKKTGELLTNQKSSGETKTDDKSKGTEAKTEDKSKASETKIEDKSKASENKTENKSVDSKTGTDEKSSEEMDNNREIGETIVQVHKPSKESIDDEIVGKLKQVIVSQSNVNTFSLLSPLRIWHY